MTPQDQDERESNQKALREILETYGLTQKQAAQLIAEQTYRSLDVRTIRTWLAETGAATARTCPLWAIMALRKAVAERGLEAKGHTVTNS